MIKLVKYQGLGNDFYITHNLDILKYDLSKVAIQVCNKNDKTDGLIVVKNNPLEMVFYNRDGSIGTMCGNGLRCFVKYCFDNHIIKENTCEVKTLAGKYRVEISNINPFVVKVEMGKPNFSNDVLKIKTNEKTFINVPFVFKNQEYKLTSLFIGTHHTVVFVDSLDILNEELGHYFCHLPIFEDRTNVDFVEVVSKNKLKVKTYERGVGYTLACGTGACASVAVAKVFNLVDSKVDVEFEKGVIKITLIADAIYMEGIAERLDNMDLFFKN